MDQEQIVSALRDELGLEIERALSVDLDPELKARVRAHLDREKTSRAAWVPWQLAGAGAMGLAIVLAVLVTWPEREDEPRVSGEQVIAIPTVQSPPAGAPVIQASLPSVGPPAQPAVSRRVPVQPPARTSELEVVIIPGELTALRLLATNIRDGHIDEGALPDLHVPSVALEPLTEIALHPITIEPIARLEPLQGERQ